MRTYKFTIEVEVEVASDMPVANEIDILQDTIDNSDYLWDKVMDTFNEEFNNTDYTSEEFYVPSIVFTSSNIVEVANV